MLIYERKEECCGCTACVNVCPQQAITMLADVEGFLYPEINQELCIECGLCQQICSFHDNYNICGNYDQPKVYAVKHRDDKVRLQSSSGGMFTALSDYILSKHGLIYGAAFAEGLVVRHQKAETTEERNKFRGSKYVQSDLNGVFEDLKAEVEKGRTVLFTGTPCQNAGLRAYLNKDYESLYLCDIVCHGTPSPLIFANFIQYCERKNQSRIKEYDFRYKGNGWHTDTEKAVYANGLEDYTSSLSQSYQALYYSHLMLRPACHNCKFCNLSRPSDITLGDYWGIEKSMPDFDDNIGVTLVLINSAKGQNLFNKLTQDLDYRESNSRDCLQPNLHTPSLASPQREQFWQAYQDKGFEHVLKRYSRKGFILESRKRAVKALDKLGLLQVAKRVMGRT